MEHYLLNKTILIVDDTPENIDVLNGLLSDFKRKIATSGERALKIALSNTPPDLILLDIMMPGMDGYEVCQKLRQDKRAQEVPVIFLTAKTEKKDIIKGFEAGGQDFVTKPFDARELMERVKTQLKLRYQQELLKNMNAVLEQKVKERTAELDIANAQLLSLDEAKNQFLMLISHEIRTPLNGIVGSAYFLSDTIDDPELQEFLGMLRESVDRLDKFSRTALEITQMQTIGREMDKKLLDINSIITKVIESKKNSADEKNINTIVELTEELHINGLENYFQRSIEELIGNAIKFSHEGTDIKIKTFGEDGNIIISVCDTGEVIPLEKIQEITKPFGLAKQHYDKHIGLGLAYVSKCLDIHDASLEIKSNQKETVITLIFDS